MPGPPADGTKKRTRSRYAVLGMLSSGLETGYAMKKHVETNLGHFWSESYGQIYPILRQLVEDGLATCTVEPQRDGRRRKRYQLTPAGWSELRTWLAQPAELPPPRHELLLKLSFGERISFEACEKLIRDYRESCERNVVELADIDAILSAQKRTPRDHPYWLMTLRYGRAIREAERRWCDETLTQLLEIQSGEARAGQR